MRLKLIITCRGKVITDVIRLTFMQPTVELRDLRCLKDAAGGSDAGVTLSHLALDDHVHGDLRIVFPDGDVLFNYGFNGPSDACIGDWVTTLHELQRMLSGIECFSYEYPFPDQGDPTLEFGVTDVDVTIRLLHYESDPKTCPHSMEPKTIPRNDFSSFVDTAIQLISDTITQASPCEGRHWLKRHTGG